MYMTEKNAERVERQRRTPITVVIGNPPYNMNQQNENDNNKNRKYEVIDERVAETYAKDSKASSKTALSDPYVKFFRWATDRLQGRDGIVAFVSNNSFVDQHAFDGMRKHLLGDFTSIYHIDLHGNVRRNPKLSGTTHNVFGIQVGVGITVAVRKQAPVAPTFRSAVRPLAKNADLKIGATKPGDNSGLRYHRVPEDWRKEQKLQQLTSLYSVSGATWQPLEPDASGNWLVPEHAAEFEALVPLGSKAAKGADSASPQTVFKVFSGGVKTNRDEVAYDFDKDALLGRVRRFIDDYNGEVDRYKRSGGKQPVDEFVCYDKIKWSGSLKLNVERGTYAAFDEGGIRVALYRPFSRRYLFFDRFVNERVYVMPSIFPTPATEKENIIIWAKVGTDWPFFGLASRCLVDVLPQGGSQCFPFYTYNEDGTNRRQNITDWALEHFRKQYSDKKITKWDIFYYVYGVLHHPEYRAKYAENLKRELPRIPLAKEFRTFAKAGKELARLHIEYEKLEPYPLKFVEASASFGVRELAPAFVPPKLASAGKAAASRRTPKPAAAGLPLSYRVEDKMRLAKDHRSLKVNDSLTLGGIPPETFEYRLGNRSALEWVIDQYQVTEDKHTDIRSDPNRADDPEYIVRLVAQVIRVSLETVKLVNSMPAL
jgi:predicted helicase